MTYRPTFLKQGGRPQINLNATAASLLGNGKLPMRKGIQKKKKGVP
jgi:hypothetical protein